MSSGNNEELKKKILNTLLLSFPKSVDFDEHKFIYDQDEEDLILIFDELEKKNYIEELSYKRGVDNTFSLAHLQLTPDGKRYLDNLEK